MWYGNSFNRLQSSADSEHRLGLRRGKPMYSDILEAADAAVRVFKQLGMPICAVGGLACKLFGNQRTPNDVDLLLLDTTTSQEELKRILVAGNSHFYLIAARDPLATYKVLWHRTTLGVRVKVDLLQPGIMAIPNIPPGLIQYKTTLNSRVPVAPFGLVLLLKLQAWAQHREATEYRYRVKQYTDSNDINILLPLVIASHTTFEYLPEDFRQEAQKRVESYTVLHPESKQHWRKLGFKLVDPSPQRTLPVRQPTNTRSHWSRPAATTRIDDLITSMNNVRLNNSYRSRFENRRETETYDYLDFYD